MILEVVFEYGAAIAFVLFLSAMYSVAETSITSIPLPKLYALKSEGNKAAIIVCELRDKKEILLGALLVASTVLDTLASALSISFAVQLGGIGWIPLATAVISVLIVVFADILPKTYAFEYPVKSALFIARFVKWSVFILYPLIKVVQYIVRSIFTLFKISAKDNCEKKSGEEMLRGSIEMGHSLGLLMNYDKKMLDGILDLSEYTVGDIMTHKQYVYCFDINTNPKQLLEEMLKTGHSRFPIYRKNKDNIIGVLYIKDLFNLFNIKKNKQVSTGDIEKILIEPWLIPSSVKLTDQLKSFRKKKMHFAVIRDNEGEMKGVISLEDILEEIVGNIDDEHDLGEKYITKCKSGDLLIKGGLMVKDLNRKMGLNLPLKDASTIGGLIMSKTDRAPKKGDVIKLNNQYFEVLKIQKGQIIDLKICKKSIKG